MTRAALRFMACLVALATLGLVSIVPALQAREQELAPVARIGVLSAGPEPMGGLQAFRETLAELGWVEGRNLHIESRFAAGSGENLAALAAELVDAKVQVILAAPSHGVRAATDATTTIPIVGIGMIERFVVNLARPEGNVTGMITIPAESWGKHLELLKEAVPGISHVAYFVDAPPGNPDLAARTAALGQSLRLTVHPFGVSSDDELKAALREALARRVDAVAVLDTPFFAAHRRRMVRFVLGNKLPAVSLFSAYAEAGFLMSYGTNISDLYRRAARYVDRVLKGATPADLPVEQPTKYDLVVNLKAARFLGLTLPQTVVQRANRLIQ
jgi:putative ABC transport system substrate-binding protein